MVLLSMNLLLRANHRDLARLARYLNIKANDAWSQKHLAYLVYLRASRKIKHPNQ